MDSSIFQRFEREILHEAATVTRVSSICAPYNSFLSTLTGKPRERVKEAITAAASKHATGKLPAFDRTRLAVNGVYQDHRLSGFDNTVMVACLCTDFRGSYLPCEHIFHTDMSIRGIVLNPKFRPRRAGRAVEVPDEATLLDSDMAFTPANVAEDRAIAENEVIFDQAPAATAVAAIQQAPKRIKISDVLALSRPAAAPGEGEVSDEDDEGADEDGVDAHPEPVPEALLTDEVLNSFVSFFTVDGKLNFGAKYLELSRRREVPPLDTSTPEPCVNEARLLRQVRSEMRSAIESLFGTIETFTFARVDSLSVAEQRQFAEEVRDAARNATSVATRAMKSAIEGIKRRLSFGADGTHHLVEERQDD